MAKKKKAVATRKTAQRAKSKSWIDKVVQAVSPTRRNSKGGNVTRRQGV